MPSKRFGCHLFSLYCQEIYVIHIYAIYLMYSGLLHWHSGIIHHDDVIKWKHFPRYWPFVREIHRSPVNPPHKGQWRGALMLALNCTWINGWVNNRAVRNLRHYRVHYDVTLMICHLDAYTIAWHNLQSFYSYDTNDMCFWCDTHWYKYNTIH